MPVSWRKIAVTLIDPPDQPMRPQPDTDACQAYIFSVDAYTQRRIHELRDEIEALQHQNALYTQHPFHTRAERHTRDLRQELLQAIKEELLSLNASPKSRVCEVGKWERNSWLVGEMAKPNSHEPQSGYSFSSTVQYRL